MKKSYILLLLLSLLSFGFYSGGGGGADEPAASDTVAGIVELATDAEAIAGTATDRAVTPAGVAAALSAPTKYIHVDWASETANSTTGEKKRVYISPSFNGYNLVSVVGTLAVAATGSTQTYQIYNETDSQDMLSTVLSIDATEKTSASAATPAVINTSYDDVATGDILRIDCDSVGSTTPGQGDKIILGFAK